MGLLSKPIKNLDDLFVHTLQDVYYAEQRITKALPKMIEKVSDPQLQEAFRSHLEETKLQIKRVEQVFEMHKAEAKAVTCPAIDGIIEEAEEIMGDSKDSEVLDAAALAAAQAGALRDRAIRDADRLGAAAGPSGLRRRARAHAQRGKGGRPEADPHRRGQGQWRRRGLTRLTGNRERPGTVPGRFSFFPSDSGPRVLTSVRLPLCVGETWWVSQFSLQLRGTSSSTKLTTSSGRWRGAACPRIGDSTARSGVHPMTQLGTLLPTSCRTRRLGNGCTGRESRHRDRSKFRARPGHFDVVRSGRGLGSS